MRADGNLLEDAEIERALLNTAEHANVVLEAQIEFTASQVRRLKEFYEDFFDDPPSFGEAKALGKEAGGRIEELISMLNPLAAQAGRYPFLHALDPAIEKLKEIKGKTYTWYLTELLKQEDALLDLKRNVISPIQTFMNGPQKEIYDSARRFVQAQESNFAYIVGDEPGRITDALADKECFKGNRMQQVKVMVESLQAKVADQVRQEIEKAKQSVTTLQTRLHCMDEVKNLSGAQQTHRIEYVASRAIQAPFDKAWLADESDVDSYLQSMREVMVYEIRRGKRIRI